MCMYVVVTIFFHYAIYIYTDDVVFFFVVLFFFAVREVGCVNRLILALVSIKLFVLDNNVPLIFETAPTPHKADQFPW